MRRELGKITKVDTSFNDSVILEKYEEVFDNITVMTYQKLTQLLVSKDSDFFKKKFDYVVCDEAHFFVADALFNPDTGFLLDELIRRYFNSIRIYMSATFDDVLTPIRCSENKCFEDEAIKLKKTNPELFDISAFDYNNSGSFARYSIAMRPKVFPYYFNCDFSSYKPHFFDDLDEIEDAIVSDYLGKTKWLIFVNSRDEGIQLVRKLNSEFKKYCDEKVKELKNATGNSATSIEVEVKKPYQDFAVFIDRHSRHKDDVSGEIWRKLTHTGVLPCKVLIATSVLDNGFSIKDDLVKNVVICTDDRVEFLQELGRRRILSEQDSVELYIRRVTPMSLNVRKSYLERQLEFYDIAYGGLQNPEYEQKKSQLAKAFKTICNHYGYNDFGYLTVTVESSNELEVHANYLARWKILCLKEEIERYEELVAQYGQEVASVIYKAEWIDLDPARAVQISELGSAPMVDLIDFLEEYVSSESNLYLNEPSFERFSRDFQDLFHRAFPDEKINTGKNRDYWKHEAINNHLKTLNERLNNGSYELKAVKTDGTSEKCFLLTFNPEH